MKTKRTQLRRWKMYDKEELFNFASDKEIGYWCTWPHHETIEDSIDTIKNVFWTSNAYAIADKVNNRLIGCISISDKKDDIYEIGYWIGRDYWNQGYATEAVNRLLSYLFINLKAEAVTCNAVIDNVRSLKVIEKCGFRKKEVIEKKRKNEIDKVVINEMTKEEFFDRQNERIKKAILDNKIDQIFFKDSSDKEKFIEENVYLKVKKIKRKIPYTIPKVRLNIRDGIYEKVKEEVERLAKKLNLTDDKLAHIYNLMDENRETIYVTSEDDKINGVGIIVYGADNSAVIVYFSDDDEVKKDLITKLTNEALFIGSDLVITFGNDELLEELKFVPYGNDYRKTFTSNRKRKV